MPKERPWICIIACVLTIIAGIVLVITGSIYTKDTSLLHSAWTQIYALSIFSIIIGGLAILFAICLIYIVYRQFPALTILFSSLLIVVGLLAAICAVVLLVGRNSLFENSYKNTVRVFSNYSSSPVSVSSNALVDKIQQEYNCCGVRNAGDWISVFPDGKSTPDSCCLQMVPGCGNKSLLDEGKLYLNGCEEPLYFRLRKKYTPLIGINFTLLVFVLIAAVFGILYERYIREQYELM